MRIFYAFIIIIYNIQGLKNGAICFATNNVVYIIQDNSEIITLSGFRKVILQLKMEIY